MQFNSHASNEDIVSEIKWWCGIPSSDTTSFHLNDITRKANMALDKVFSLVMLADNRWQIDDSNNTDLPRTTTTLVDEQADYSIPVTWEKIHRVRVKDSAGNYQTLDPVDQRELSDERLNSASGMPKRYYLRGNSYYLQPKPGTSYVTTAQGLEITFQRGASHFTTSDTTKTPGFAVRFHELIPLYVALPYCQKNKMKDEVKAIQEMIAKLELSLIEHYSTRNVDRKPSLRLQKEDFGEMALGQDSFISSNHPDRF